MKYIFLIIAALVISLPAFAADKNSAYDRVMKNNTIRCGYGTSKPWIWQDAATGKMTGMNVKIMEEVAHTLGMALDWPEETGWGELPTSLYSGRVDVACSTLWNDPARGKQIAFTRPLFYTAIHAYMREDETRFGGDIGALNNPDIRIAVQDGDFGTALVSRFFPQAQIVTIPSTTSWSDIFMNVALNKADIAFADSIAAQNYNDNNEKKLKRIPLADPVSVYGNALAVSIHESALKELLDNTISYMLQTGAIEQLTRDFRTTYPDAIVLPIRPY